MAELASPQPLTPVPRGYVIHTCHTYVRLKGLMSTSISPVASHLGSRRSDEEAAAVSSSATEKAGGGAMKVKLPDAIRCGACV